MKNYEICMLNISSFKENKNGTLETRLNDFPYRLCVLDKNKKIAVDVKLSLQYKYIESSLIYFSLEIKNLKGQFDKRFAMYKEPLKIVSDEDIMLALNVRNRMINKENFRDGNEISNEEYFEMLKNEEDKNEHNRSNKQKKKKRNTNKS